MALVSIDARDSHADLRAGRARPARGHCDRPAARRRPAADGARTGGRPAGQRQHHRAGVCRARARGRPRDTARRRLVRQRDAGARPAQRPSATVVCARSPHASLADAAAAGFTVDDVIGGARRPPTRRSLSCADFSSHCRFPRGPGSAREYRRGARSSLVSLAVGLGVTLVDGNPIPLVVMAAVGAIAHAGAAESRSNGNARSCCVSAGSSACRARDSSGSCRLSTRCRRGSISARSRRASPPSRR